VRGAGVKASVKAGAAVSAAAREGVRIMAQCPQCGLMLTTRTVAGADVAGCEVCGGAWLADGELKRLAQSGREALLELENAFRGSLAPPRRDGEPLCPDCGAALAAQGVKAATELAFLHCARCQHAFLADGQARALADRIAPLPTPAQTTANPPADEDEEVEAETTVVKPWWTPRAHWDEREPGHPWIAWAVCGMPFWCAVLMALAPAVMTGSLPTFAMFATAAMLWVSQSLVLTIALKIVWAITGEDPGLDFFETMVPVLRAVAAINLVVLLVNAAAYGLCVAMASPADGPWFGAMLGFVLAITTRLALYREIMELEWWDVLALTVAQVLVEMVFRGAL
jgi:Zn-finger nucleic acid-binding protein